MAAKFSLSDSLAERQKLTNAQYREIERLYKDLARKAAKEAERLKSSTVSGKLQAVELKKLEKKLQEEAEKIGARLESAIPSAMKKAAAGVVSDAASFQGKLGISIEGAYRRVPTDIVETLVSGKLYKGKWSLSKSIWADISKTQSDISKVVAEGIALNKSSYDIAKDLEMYVDPSAKKPWDWSKVYPGTKKKIDYNAQRLARTMVGHAYQQSVVAVCKDDPFVDGIEWISGHSTTTCELCRDRNGKVFPAGKLPLDHPNGKCSFAPHVSKSLSQIGDDLADWVSGKPNKQLDKWFSTVAKDYTMGVEQSKLAIQTGKPTRLVDLPEVSIQEASDSWFEYENANLMSEYIRSGIMPDTNMYEQPVSDNEQKILMAQALKLQEEASKTKTKYRAVYRGMVLQEDELAGFKRNVKYTFETITASATDKKIASIYTDVGNAGGEGVPVLLEIENPRGIRGYNRDDLEIVLPKGAQYRIEQTFYDENGVFHVRMYAGKNLG